MKGKAVTYLLLILVLAVWGIIIFKILDAVGSKDDDTEAVVPKQAIKENFNDYTIHKDTTKLLLNYRDPFDIKNPKDTLKERSKLTMPKRVFAASIAPAINWGFIQYSGYIRNPSSKKLITMVTINGKNEMIAEGETKDQVKLLKNMRDSIKVSYNGKVKGIKLKTQ